MAILKMKAVTLAGQLDDFERVVSNYVDGRDIHLENAIMVLEDLDRLVPFTEDNQYDAISKNVYNILRSAGLSPKHISDSNKRILKSDMLDEIAKINNLILELQNEKTEFQSKIDANMLVIEQLKNMSDFNEDLTKIFKFEFIKVRFGRIPKGGYKTLDTYLSDMETIFLKTGEDEKDVWGFYFMPKSKADRIDAIFSSLYFERVYVSDKVCGTPKESEKALLEENDDYLKQIELLDKEIRDVVETDYDYLSEVYFCAQKNQFFADVRKNAAHSDEFFYIIGWMSEKEAIKLEHEINNEEKVIFFSETPDKVSSVIKPPTKLKNFRLFRPFEMFVKMYGLPSYGEVDPTPILALTYILMFGIMFGDVGQSAIFAIAGFIIYKVKKMDLAAMISMVGVSGMAFGFIYGSIFGNETLLENVRLIEPMEKINFMLISAIVLGVVIILFCMAVNIVNGIRSRDYGRVLFSNNGVAGLLFYLGLISLVANMVLDLGISSNAIAVVLVIAFLLMYLHEPLSHLIEGKKDWLPKSGMFYVENFFEMFDVVLCFATNTISFIRVGAFAIIHVGMMLAISILAGDGNGAIVVKIIGNIVVMGLEGLIVGIQVLRLQYYEMFSRYFEGKGKEFVSLDNE